MDSKDSFTLLPNRSLKPRQRRMAPWPLTNGNSRQCFCNAAIAFGAEAFE